MSSPGSVRIAGIDPVADPEGARRHLGVAADPRVLPPALPGAAYLELVAHARGVAHPSAVDRKRVAALDLTDRLSDPIATYSLGMRQKLSLVAALLADPAVIVLDESLSNLDPVSAARVKRWLVEITDGEGRAVLLASHLLDSVEKLSTRVGLLHEGRLLREWTANELATSRADGSDLEELFIRAIEAGP
jgi:ABC-type multidrug transport system ATPase subunit